MTEREEYETTADYQRGRLDALEHLLHMAISAMPEQTRSFISRSMWEYSKNMENSAQNDVARNEASAIYNTSIAFDNAMEDWGDAIREANAEL